MTTEKRENNKETCLEVLNAAIGHIEALKAEVEESDNPNMSVVVSVANEETGRVRGCNYGSAMELASTLAAAFEENPEVLKMASFAQSLHSGGNPLQDLLSSLSSED